MVSGSLPVSLIASARTRRHRGVAGQAPFRPRAIINSGLRPAEEVEAEGQRASSDARAAAGDDRLAALEPGRREQRGERLGGEQGARLAVGQLVIGQVEAAGDVARAQPGPWLLGATPETPARARVDDLLASRRQIVEDLPLVADGQRI